MSQLGTLKVECRFANLRRWDSLVVPVKFLQSNGAELATGTAAAVSCVWRAECYCKTSMQQSWDGVGAADDGAGLNLASADIH